MLNFLLTVPRRVLLITAITGLLLAGGIMVFVYIPRATITLYPATTTRSANQDIVLSRQAEAADFIRYTLPATVIEKTVEKHKEFVHQGGRATENFAKGRVTLVNDQDADQPLLPKTHLKHEATGVYFLTDQSVIIPAHSSVDVSATAKEKGAASEVGPGKFIIDRLPVAMQIKVYGRSAVPFRGGLTVESPITEDELARAKNEVRHEAEQQLTGELTAEANGATINPALRIVETEAEQITAEPGDTVSAYSVQYRLTGRAFVIDENDLLSLTLLALRSKPDPDFEFATYDPATFKIEVKRLSWERGEAAIKTTLGGTFAAKVSPTALNASQLAGRTKAEVEEYFKKFPPVGRVEVAFSPFWVKTVPTRASAVELSIKSAGAGTK